MKKIKYERPFSLDAGEVASVMGQRCANGSSPTEGCFNGNNPNVGPTCTPGNIATYFCSTGSTNTTGNCADGLTARGCYNGSTP